MTYSVRLVLLAAAATVMATSSERAVRAQSPAPAAAAPSLLQTSESQRMAYLGHAVIWKPGGVPTPDQLRQGPPGRYPLAGVPTEANGEIVCTYDHGGAGSPGRTAKFTCRTKNGRAIRVKYYDGNPKTGNREVFAEVVATRLFWAVGFDADPMYPVVVLCQDCPENPMTGVGPRTSRRYLGVVEAFYEGAIISSKSDPNQGWRFAEVASAIAALPAGEARSQQRVYFEALALLGVFVQHGDRKPSQQRLVCRSALAPAAGDVRPIDNDEGFHVPVFYEHSGERACQETGITIQDLGATFGGAGQFTTNVGAKVHLSSWGPMPVFQMPSLKNRRPNEVPSCFGNLTASGSAGPDAAVRQRISDAGRQFLHGRLSALTPDHLKAIFEAARLNELEERQQFKDPKSGQTLTGTDAWVAAFQHKVDEIGRTRCPN